MIRHNTYRIPSFIAGIYLLFTPCAFVRAQTAPTPPAPSGAPPADVLKTMSQVGDLDLLVALTPLNLNVTQIDKTLALLESIKSGGADIAKLNDESLRGIADDVEKARAAALKGTVPDAEVKARIKKALDAIGKRETDTDAASTKRAATFLEATLTPEQIKLIVADYTGWMGGKITVPAKYKDDPDDRKEFIQQTALGEYAARILLTQRAIDLLHKMRESAPPAPAETAPPTATTPPAATPPAATPPATTP